MTGEKIAYEIKRIIHNQLEDCERAIKNEDSRRALSEIDDAMRKLKRLANSIQSL